jgi:flagellar biosynthesis protein FlhB
MEVNWIITLLIGSLLSIPISVLANLMTPVFQKWFEKQAGSVRNKSLARLKREYERVKNFREQPTLLQLAVNEYLIRGIILICALVIGVTYFVIVYFIDNMPSLNNALGSEIIKSGSFFMSSIIWLFTMVFILTFISGLFDLLSDYSRLKQFDKFEKKSLARISELENINKKTNS